MSDAKATLADLLKNGTFYLADCFTPNGTDLLDYTILRQRMIHGDAPPMDPDDITDVFQHFAVAPTVHAAISANGKVSNWRGR